MKLFASFSEAIREGARLHPQTDGELMDVGGTCAIGAGLFAIGGALLVASVDDCQNSQSDDALAADIWYPYLRNPAPPCPVSTCDEMWGAGYDLSDRLWHLNDNHEWTRERIADWLETEEAKLGYVTLNERDAPEVVASGKRAGCPRLTDA